MSCAGGPLGSTATIAFTRFGRLSAIGQPMAPDWEWVSRIAGPILSSSAGPLGMQMRLRPQIIALRRRKPLQGAIEIGRGDRAVALRPVAGTAARHLIDDIDRVAAPQEKLRPAFAAVGS